MFGRYLAPYSQSSSRDVRAADPFTELHREMNRLFDDFVGGGSSSQQATTMAPRLDVKERENELCVSAELPGVEPGEVDVRLEGSLLTIRGEKKAEAEQEKEDWHIMERSYGRFQRSLQLPFEPDASQVRADFKQGVLTIHIPKQPQQERSRRIEIDAGAQDADGQQTNVHH
jgi:HSP20 family protein